MPAPAGCLRLVALRFAVMGRSPCRCLISLLYQREGCDSQGDVVSCTIAKLVLREAPPVMPQDITALKTTLAKEIEERRQTFAGRKSVDVGDLPGFLDLIERARQLHAVEPYAEAINLDNLQFVRQVVLSHLNQRYHRFLSGP